MKTDITGDDLIRCFLAVPLAAQSSALLDSAVTRLKPFYAEGSVRWVAASNRHMTLAFLGDQTPETVLCLQAPLQSALAAVPAFVLEGVAVSGFPDAKSRIVALELECTAALKGLLSSVHAVLARQGLAVERRPYRPHVTLGRLDGRLGRGGSRRPLFQPVAINMPVSSLVLYRSRLLPSGSEYEPVWEVALI